jgi:hypothetical protein
LILAAVPFFFAPCGQINSGMCKFNVYHLQNPTQPHDIIGGLVSTGRTTDKIVSDFAKGEPRLKML